MEWKKIILPQQNRPVVLVPRESLRSSMVKKKFVLPGVPMGEGVGSLSNPPPPPVFDGSKGRKIKYPMLGNDTVGDCYLADALHCIQTWTGNVLPAEAQFDLPSVLALYRQLSGGDNGLNDNQIFTAWKAGIFGHKILDEMVVDHTNAAAIQFCIWKFFGVSWTAALLTGWINATNPGQVWDAGMGQSDQTLGHAMHLSGYGIKTVNGQLCYQLETWAIDPAIELTPAGMNAADPEVTVQFSLDMFDANGVAPDGETYAQKAATWVACGGNTLPPSPFGPPVPPVPPIPPVPPMPPGPATGNHLVLQTTLVAGNYPIAGSPVPAGMTLVQTAAITQLQQDVMALAPITKGVTRIIMQESLMDLQHEMLNVLQAHHSTMSPVAPLPSVFDKLASTPLPWAKIMKILMAILAFSRGAMNPATIAALVAQVQAILTGP